MTHVSNRRFASTLVVASSLIAGCQGDPGHPPSDRAAAATPAAPVVVAVDASVTYQVMSGWEAGIAEAREFGDSLEVLRESFLDSVVDLGINRLRVELRSGIEHENDNWAEWRAKRLDKNDPWWKSVMYETVNDNDDAFVINPAGFHFSDLDFDIETVVNPLRERLAARGESLLVNFTYMAFTHNNRWSSTYVHQDPDEYAEFVLASYQHMERRFGWVPDCWEVILEPDNTWSWRLFRYLRGPSHWTGDAIGRAIAAAGSRLEAAGFTPRFAAPSTLNAAKALKYFHDARAIPGAARYLKELTYHRYSGSTEQVVASIGQTARQVGADSAMLELIGGDQRALHKDLTLGNVSAWSQYRLASIGSDTGGVHFVIDRSTADRPQLAMGRRSRYLRHYFRYIRRGATRIAATSSNPSFNPVAFIAPGGALTVVVLAETGGSFNIRGLRVGTYGVTYTTDSDPTVDGPDGHVNGDGVLATSIPSQGVITIYQKPPAQTGEQPSQEAPAWDD
jgi:hypothetical protein